MHTLLQRKAILWFHTTWSLPCYLCSTSLDDNIKILFVASTYEPQLVEQVRKTCYEPHSVTPNGVPIRRLPNSSANVGQLAHLYRQHSPIQATTQGMLVFIRHPKPQFKRCHSEPQLKECHVFTLYPESQLKGYHSKPQLKKCHSKVHP